MPLGDGTGPGGFGRGSGRGRRGLGAGRSENCVCISCGEKIVHQAGIPCSSMKCPKCGENMVRE